MKKSNLLPGTGIVILLFVSMMVFPLVMTAQDKGTFTDSRDGRVYAWVKIGTQTWMAENLKFDAKVGSWTYNNDTANLAVYGRLYNWKTAQAACPKGWHVPSDKEWGALIQTLGGGAEAGGKMIRMDTVVKVNRNINANNPGTFSSLLSGIRHPDGSCIGINFWGGCWSSTKINDSTSNNVLFAHGRKDLDVSSNDKNAGFSVRCIKK
ncbi:MAG: FISUMP domain-containing protein [Bacteroidota bacterium]